MTTAHSVLEAIQETNTSTGRGLHEGSEGRNVWAQAEEVLKTLSQFEESFIQVKKDLIRLSGMKIYGRRVDGQLTKSENIHLILSKYKDTQAVVRRFQDMVSTYASSARVLSRED